VVIFARRDIAAGEELTYNYRFSGAEELACYCGAAGCKGKVGGWVWVWVGGWVGGSGCGWVGGWVNGWVGGLVGGSRCGWVGGGGTFRSDGGSRACFFSWGDVWGASATWRK
jgi:hypothetical protein